MTMQILEGLEQGSDKWKEVRGKYLCASEAPIIMGQSPFMTREELLHAKTSGAEQEITRWMEIIFERGHEVEALARPIAEARMGDDLFPLVGVGEVANLPLLASFDGITEPFHDMHWEHKQFNKDLFETVQAQGELPPKIFWQLEHQLLVNVNDRCIFAVSDGTEDNYAEMEYVSRPERIEQLIEGWKIFLKDMKTYDHEAVPVKPEGETIKDLPALVVEITGGVKSSNLSTYRQTALAFIENINSDLQTDEDFATAENVVKFLDSKEKELVIVERAIIGQVSSIEEITRTIAELKESMRKKRLTLNNLIKTEKENRRAEIIQKAKNTWIIYVQEINALLSPVQLPQINADFIGAIKGKRTIESLRSAANAELTRVRIEANRWQNHITANLQSLREIGKDHMFLFNDLQQLVLKDKDALEAIAKQRIAEHKAAEEKRIQAEAEKIAAAAELKRQEEERQRKAEEDRKAEQDRITARKAAEQEQAARVSENTAVANMARSEAATASFCGETYDQAPSYEPTPPPAGKMHIRPSFAQKNVRPTDADIIKVLALHYRVHESKVIEWLLDMDLNAEADLMPQGI